MAPKAWKMAENLKLSSCSTRGGVKKTGHVWDLRFGENFLAFVCVSVFVCVFVYVFVCV